MAHLTPPEEHDPQEIMRKEDFTRNVTEFIGTFNEDMILTIERDEMEEPIMGDPDIDDEDDKESNTRDAVPGPNEFDGAKIFLPYGDHTEIAKVIGSKCDRDGLYIGRKHTNPFLDSRIFIVEFPDGTQKDIGYNVLTEHLYSQVDEEGNQYRLFRDIIGHRRMKQAIEKADQYHTDGRGQ